MVCVGFPIELAHCLSTDAAAAGKLSRGSCLPDAGQKDKLEPLGKGHGIHGERLLEGELFRTQSLILPKTAAPQFSLNLIRIVRNCFWNWFWHSVNEASATVSVGHGIVSDAL